MPEHMPRHDDANPPLPNSPSPLPSPPGDAHVFDLDGGRVCLDFANSFDSSGEHLVTYLDLLAFAAQSDLITPADADWLRDEASRQPDLAEAVLVRARRLRDAIRAIFASVAAGQTPPESPLAMLNADLAASLSHACLRSQPDGQTYQWAWTDRSLATPVWPVTRSAADVLVSEHERRLVRQCGAGDCAWLFLDTSKNRSRHWCSMRSCGNREKARRHYQRARATRDVTA